MLTPVEHPADEDGDLYDEDSDYVEEVLDDLAYDWNKRAKDSRIDSFVFLGKEILDQIDKYANKVHGVEQIHQVDLLRKRIKELEEIHNKEFKENLVKAVHDTGSRVTQRHHHERITDSDTDEPAHWDGAQRPMDWDGTSVAPNGDLLTIPGLSEMPDTPSGTYIYSSSGRTTVNVPSVEPAVRIDGGIRYTPMNEAEPRVVDAEPSPSRIASAVGEMVGHICNAHVSQNDSEACCDSAPGCSG